MPGKETSVTFIGLLLCFFQFQINWFRSFDDKRNFFYSIFILCIRVVGMFVSVRSTHGAYLKTILIDLLPIRGVNHLGWFFEQPLLNDFFTGDGSFLPTNSHEGKMKKMIGFFATAAAHSWPMHIYLFMFSMYFFADLFCIVIF